MPSIKDEAQAYEQKQTRNISDLDEVPIDIEVKDDSFTFKERDKETGNRAPGTPGLP